MMRMIPALVLAFCCLGDAHAQPCADYGSGSRLTGTALLSGGTHVLALAGDLLLDGDSFGDPPGLTIRDMSDPAAPRLLSVWDPGASIHGVTVIEGFAYLVTDDVQGTITVLDIRNPEQPTPVPVPELTESTYWLESEGDLLYAIGRDAEDELEVRVYRPDQDGHPQLLGNLPCDGYFNAPAVCDSLVLACPDAGLPVQIYDFTDPEAPRRRGDCAVAVEEVLHMTKLGNVLYVSGGGGAGIECWQIVDPDHPVFLGSQFPNTVFEPTFRWLGRAADRVVGLHYQDALLTLIQEPSGLLGVDGISPGYVPGSFRSTALEGVRLCTVDTWPGILRTYDLASAGTPHPLAMLTHDGAAVRVTTHGDEAYALITDGGVRRLARWDLTDPTDPAPGDFAELPSEITSIVVGGTILLATGWNGGVDVFSLSAAGGPHLLASLATDAPVADMVVSEGLAVVAEANRVHLIDLSDPSVPIDHPFDHVATVQDLALRGPLLAVFDRDDVALYDVSVPSDPNLLGAAPLAQGYEPVYPNGALGAGIACAAFGDSLAIYDIADGSPSRIAAIALPMSHEQWTSMELRESTLYLASEDGLFVVDVGDPSAPILRGEIGAIGLAASFALTGNAVVGITGLGTWPERFQLLTYPLQCNDTVAIDPIADPAGHAPSGLRPRILSTHPNPFNPRVDLAFMIPQAGPAVIDVVDLAGRRVAALWDGPLPVGPWRTSWDGRDLRGRSLAAGPYLVRVRTEQGTDSRTITLVR